MPVYRLPLEPAFPHPSEAESDGLLGIGGDLTPDWLILAYASGIFPWFSDDEPILWWSPDPRYLLFPAEVKVSKSMKQVFKQKTFTLTFDRDFAGVIRACKTTRRPGQRGTWITDEMEAAYIHLHALGFAHSVEAWQDGKLVGGLYGVSLGKAFFGESMFAHVSNASKAAFIYLCQALTEREYGFVDCQVATEHLISLGAVPVRRNEFLMRLQEALDHPFEPGSWA